jgi:5-methylcytosine-specific restriction endonuclease McrA
MRAISKPTAKAKDVLLKCAETVEDAGLKLRLIGIATDVETGETIYKEHASKGTLHALTPTTAVGAVSRKEMTWVYESKLARKGDAARPFYDALRVSAPHGICPLCGHRTVTTLDHYLAKSQHALFAVTPVNLVPACGDCNKAKLHRAATGAGQQTLHPYFDDVKEAWLCADVVEDEPPAVLFRASPPTALDAVLQQRVAAHFDAFELAALFAANAAQELVQIGDALAAISTQAGPLGVRDHLLLQAMSRGRIPNSWQAALYRALSTSEWFWSGGHRTINASHASKQG